MVIDSLAVGTAWARFRLEMRVYTYVESAPNKRLSTKRARHRVSSSADRDSLSYLEIQLQIDTHALRSPWDDPASSI